MHLDEMELEDEEELAQEVLNFLATKNINCPGCICDLLSNIVLSIQHQEEEVEQQNIISKEEIIH